VAIGAYTNTYITYISIWLIKSGYLKEAQGLVDGAELDELQHCHT
jgi:hypothetical protein